MKELKQIVNKVYEPMFTQHPRYVILMGGRGAGRSTVASQLANARLTAPEYFRCAIMRYVLGDIRNSIYREILDRAEENGIKDSLEINESTMTIKYGMNSINAVGFRKSSADQKAKLKSLANYNCIIIEEADEIPEADFMQLDDSLRTVKGNITIILLLNPPSKSHWIIQRWFDLLPTFIDGRELKDFYTPKLKDNITDTLFIGTSYKDNIKNIAEQSIVNYERYRNTKPDHYWNMVRGLVPEVVRGKIYSGWQVIDSVPFEARLERRAVDFGYTNDPTAIVDIYYYNGGYIIDELAFQTGLLNRHIIDIIKNQKEQVMVIADSAEPKSIDEISEAGVIIEGADKGSDSIRNGIQVVQAQKISITRRSKNIIKEYENYAWDETKDGETLNEPKPLFDHSMDAIRYGITSIKKNTSYGEAKKLQENKFKINRVRQGDNSTR
jgi:phage terminase large subunit